jgi:hypothetical protein
VAQPILARPAGLRVSILAPSDEDEQPKGERRSSMELLLIVIILLLLFGGFSFSRR